MKYFKTKTALLTVAALALVIAFPEISHAQNSEDWIKPAVGLIEVLQSGLVQLGAAVIGIGIIIVGAYMGVTGDLAGKKLAGAICGGILVVAGPKMLAALLLALQ